MLPPNVFFYKASSCSCAEALPNYLEHNTYTIRNSCFESMNEMWNNTKDDWNTVAVHFLYLLSEKPLAKFAFSSTDFN